MNPIIRHPSTLVLGEVLTAACNIGKEILQYKRAISELELQREQMHQQANMMHHQIQAQLAQEIKRINSLSTTFKHMLKQNKLFIQQHAQREVHIQQQCTQLMQMLAQCTDPQMQNHLMSMWQSLSEQMTANREESKRLHEQLRAAHHQFGIDLSQPSSELKDVL